MILQEVVTSTLSTFLTNVGTVLSSAAEWVGTVVETVMTTPVLLVPCALGFAFVAIRIFKSLKG